MQRLAQVVAGGGEELRLGAAGRLGSAARCSDTPISACNCAASFSLCAFSRITWSSALRCTRPITSSAM
ncbi:MAG TPA: hypothetical protein P5163_13775, partial [Rubrivivax sp.]|nr:hypothetical protein [Rubrivivax sp.]